MRQRRNEEIEDGGTHLVNEEKETNGSRENTE